MSAATVVRSPTKLLSQNKHAHITAHRSRGAGRPGAAARSYYGILTVGTRRGAHGGRSVTAGARLHDTPGQQYVPATMRGKLRVATSARQTCRPPPSCVPSRMPTPSPAHGTWPRGLSPIAGGPSHLEQLSTGARAVGLSLQASHPQHYVHQGDALEGRRRVGLAFERADLILVRVRVGVGVRVGVRVGLGLGFKARLGARLGLGLRLALRLGAR